MYRKQTFKTLISFHFYHHDYRIQLHFNVFSYDSIDLVLFAFLFWQALEIRRKKNRLSECVYFYRNFCFSHWARHVLSCLSLQSCHYFSFYLAVKILRLDGYVRYKPCITHRFYPIFSLGGKAYNSKFPVCMFVNNLVWNKSAQLTETSPIQERFNLYFIAKQQEASSCIRCTFLACIVYYWCNM